MDQTRREVLFYLSSLSVIGISGCSSGSNSAPNTTLSQPSSDDVVSCNEITPFTPLDQVELCGSLIDENSAQARALQWESPSTKQSRSCASCTLYQGAAGTVSGACPLFPAALTSSGAWCTAYVPEN